ncbi:hypothetical protein ABW21_db0201610 [Orbilia brochopaga]|nr:hypothetical protein ABW21_db0201610 [Drechslerella brochopaga]
MFPSRLTVASRLSPPCICDDPCRRETSTARQQPLLECDRVHALCTHEHTAMQAMDVLESAFLLMRIQARFESQSSRCCCCWLDSWCSVVCWTIELLAAAACSRTVGPCKRLTAPSSSWRRGQFFEQGRKKQPAGRQTTKIPPWKRLRGCRSNTKTHGISI